MLVILYYIIFSITFVYGMYFAITGLFGFKNYHKSQFGRHKPKHKLGEYMVKSAENALNEIDVVLMLIEPTEKVLEKDKYVLEYLKNVKTPVILVINKIDTIEKQKLLQVIDNYRKEYRFAEVVPISAIKGQNTEELLNVIQKYLPEGPQYFPEDMVTDQPERQIVSEIIREKMAIWEG